MHHTWYPNVEPTPAVGSPVFRHDFRRSIMNVFRTTALVVFVAVSAVACAPKYPLATVIPGPQTNFTAFNAQDEACRAWAAERTHLNATKITLGAVGGTVLGVAVGVGGGALATRNTMSVHDQYDRAYTQCMYAQGNQIPLTLDNVQPRDNRPTILYGSGTRRYSRPIIYSTPSSFPR
jgi:hypothetical protein